MSTSVSVLEEPRYRRRARIFHHALRAFANPNEVQPSTDCVDLRQAPDGAVLEDETCHNSALWRESERRRPFFATTEEETIRVILGAGRGIAEDGSMPIHVNVAEMNASELALRACELATRGRPFVCHAADLPLLYPGDRSVSVTQEMSFEVSSFGATPSVLLYDDATIEPFTVTASVVWPVPETLGAIRWPRNGVPRIDLDPETLYLWQEQGVQIFVVREDGPPWKRQPQLFAESIPFEPTRARLNMYLPIDRADTDVHLEAHYPSALSEETVVRSSTLRIRGADHVGGQFYECMTLEESGQAPGRYWRLDYTLVGDDRVCLYLPWWKSDDIHFLWLALFLSILIWMIATRRSGVEWVVIPEKTVADYRETARVQWSTKPFRSSRGALQNLGLTLVPVPFVGWFGVSRVPVRLFFADGFVERRRRFWVRSGMLLQVDGCAVLFSSKIDAKNRLADLLEESRLCEARLDEDTAFVRRMLAHSQRKRWVAKIGGGILLFGLGVAIPWVSAAWWPIFTQRLPVAAFSLIALAVLGVTVRLLWRQKHALTE